MKKIVIFICLMPLIIFSTISLAQNIVTGKIIEGGNGEKFIQVGDRNYIVGMVLVDIGSGIPSLGSPSDLKFGEYVEIYVRDKNADGFWTMDKVIVYKGGRMPPGASDD